MDIDIAEVIDKICKIIAPKCVIGLDRDGVINEDLGTYCNKHKTLSQLKVA